jgi:hypothetical protein
MFDEKIIVGAEIVEVKYDNVGVTIRLVDGRVISLSPESSYEGSAVLLESSYNE